MNLSALYTKYDHFERCTYTIRIIGKQFYPSTSFELIKLDIETSLYHDANIASFEVGDITDNASLYSSLQTGAKVEITIGYQGKEMLAFMGYLHEITFIEGRIKRMERVEVTCMDVKGLMMLHKSSSYQTKKKASLLIKAILQSSLYKTYIASTKMSAITTCMDKEVYMDSKSDYDILCEFADFIGYEFFVKKDVLMFRKAYENTSTDMVIDTWEGIEEVSQTTSLKEMFGKVKIIGCEGFKKSHNVSQSISSTNRPQTKKLSSILSFTYLTHIDQAYESMDELSYIAKIYKKDIEHKYAHMRCRSVILPELTCSDIVQFNDVLDKKKKLYITHIHHVIEGKQSFSEWEGRMIKG